MSANNTSNAKYSMDAASKVIDVAALTEPFRFGLLAVNEATRELFLERLAITMTRFCEECEIPAWGVLEIITHFFDDYLPKYHSLRLSSQGSTSIGGLLLVYVMAKLLRPDVIVESGVWVGSSLHTLQNACPTAQTWAFDVNFAPLKMRLPGVRYVEQDWTVGDATAHGMTGFCFFDDHIDNAKRICEAHSKGFTHLLFDDAPDLSQLGLYLFPGVPSVPMIIGDVPEGTVVEWEHKGKWRRYEHTRASCAEAARLIDVAVKAPDLNEAAGLYVGHKWYVRLRSVP